MTPRPADHYFTAQPASDSELRTVPVRLAGREVEVVTAGGIFSPDGIDKGTRVLLDEVPPPPPTGTFLDLGCGWGPLALTMALESPQARVHAVDVNERALDLCRRNAQTLGCPGVQVSTPDAVDPATTLDLIWSNPPIRVGKAVLHDLLTTWLPRLRRPGAADEEDGSEVGRSEEDGSEVGWAEVGRAEEDEYKVGRSEADGSEVGGSGASTSEGHGVDGGGGTAYLVVQKNLGADSLQTWLERELPALMGPVEVVRTASAKGFRVLRVRHAATVRP